MRLFAAVSLLALSACTSSQVSERAPSSVRDPASSAARYVLPPAKEAVDGAGVFVVHSGTRIRLRGSREAYAANLLREELLPKAAAAGTGGTITLELLPDWSAFGRDLGPEGYVLEVLPEGVRAVATGEAGLFWAAQTLLQLAGPGGTIPAVRVTDWPDVKDRMALYDLRFDKFDLAYMKRWVHELSRVKINQLMLFLSGDYRYEKYPFVASPEKLTPEKLRELKAYAAAHHVAVVPQVESLGHADNALSHEEFRDIRLGADNTYAYSPCAPRTYSVLGDFYRELTTELDQSDIFHVGGDEVWGFDGDPRCGVRSDDEAGQSRLYSRHMQRLSAILKGMHRRMGIWSDMILKHPVAAEGLSRDTVIFDWDYSEDYKRFDDFPSLKTFKELGFHDIYATAAVLGFHDMYPLLPVAFQNIRGFTQAALREDIHSVCVTIWEMQPGNNAENYLYGLAWEGNITWSSRSTDLEDFNHRFAAEWFGIRDGQAAAHADRALWFPWRVTGSSRLTEKDVSGFWQTEHLTADLLYAKLDEIAGERTSEELRRMPSESDELVHHLDVAAGSIRWLRAHARRNPMTIDSMEMSNVFYRFLAYKVKAVATLAAAYGDAYASGNRAGALSALELAQHDLEHLKRRYPGLRRHLGKAVKERNRGAEELGSIEESLRNLEAYGQRLEQARAAITGGAALPEPKSLGLAPKARAN